MKNLGRTLRQATATLAVLLALVCAAPSHAQMGGGYSSGGNYDFSIPGYHGMGGSGGSTLFDASFAADGGFDLGCGGIGLFDFVKSTFNLNNIMEQFKGSMQTMLAKTLLTQLMSQPQIAALFDTLNAFGNARFDLFQQSCNMGEIQQEAKRICVNRCIAQGKAPATCEESECNNSGGMLGSVSSELKKKLIENENVNESLRGVLCNDGTGTYAPSSDSCFIMALMPQFRLCLRSSIGETCTGNYGARNSPISVATIRDAGDAATSRFIGRADDYYRSSGHLALPRVVRETAARNAVARAAQGEEPENCGGDEASTDEQVQRLVSEYKESIGCKEEKPLALACLYNEELRKLSPGSSLPELDPDVDISDIEQQFGENLTGDLQEAYGKDMEGLKEILKVGTACHMNSLGAADPFLWNMVGGMQQDRGNSFVRGLGNEGGCRLGLSVARFTRNWLKGKYPEVGLDQQTRNPLAAEKDATTEGEEYQQQVEKDTAEVIKKTKQDVINTAVDNLDRYIEATELSCRQDREYQESLSRVNGQRMDQGFPPYRGQGLY